MKKIIAVLLIAAFALTAAACGAKQGAQTTEPVQESTDPAATEPEIGRIGEKKSFYVYIPDRWCKMEYTGDESRIRLFDTPSAPKIEEGKTAEVEIQVAAEQGNKEVVNAAVAELMKIDGAKKEKKAEIDGESFTVVTYTEPTEKRVYTAYIGLGGGNLATITLKGIEPTNENAAAILNSISFKSPEAREKYTTTTRPTTAAANKTTTAAADKTTAAADKTTAAGDKTTAAAEKTTDAAKTTTTALAKTATTTAAAKTTAVAG